MTKTQTSYYPKYVSATKNLSHKDRQQKEGINDTKKCSENTNRAGINITYGKMFECKRMHRQRILSIEQIITTIKKNIKELTSHVKTNMRSGSEGLVSLT